MSSLTGAERSYEPFSPVIATSSLSLQGSVSNGRIYERKKLDARLLGSPVNSSTGLLPGLPAWPSPNVMEVTDGLLGVPTGSLSIPSWTHAYLGNNQAFVISALTSSNHAVKVLNTFQSASEVLESGPVSATAPTFFSKERRLQTVVVKKTASFQDTIVRPGSWVPQTFFPGTGSYISTVTGSDSTIPSFPAGTTSTQPNTYTPCRIPIDVPVSGKLVDIKVWFECIVVSGTGDSPLASLAISLRNPNLTWGNAHPIRNDPKLIRVYTADLGDFTISASDALHGNFARTNGVVNTFYRDTFILWEGPVCWGGRGFVDVDNNVFPSHNLAKMLPCWHTDRGMRTVFSDGASVPNPRHLYGPVGQNYIGAPSTAKGFTSAMGAQVPWTSDQTVPGNTTHQAAGSPPAGWLNGPGGKADVNEWPTTGVNYGTNELRPLYPLLDPIYQVKRLTNEAPPISGSSGSFRPDIWKGFRPGLRGSEISGTWELFICCATVPQDTYFRQVRLEITYETPSFTRPTVNRLPRRSQALRSADRMVSEISGSDLMVPSVLLVDDPLLALRAGWDSWISQNFIASGEENEVGRSFGITPLSGNFSNDSALFYRLSGTLANIVGETPAWLFTGNGGMPSIPESSASLAPRIEEPISTGRFNEFLLPRRTLDSTQLLQSVAADLNPPKTLRDLAAEFTGSVAT